MSKFIEFHDEQGVKILTHTEGLVLRLTTELEISNSTNTWKITNNPQTAYVLIRKQLGVLQNNANVKSDVSFHHFSKQGKLYLITLSVGGRGVFIDEKYYPTQKAAAEAMGYTESRLSQILSNGLNGDSV